MATPTAAFSIRLRVRLDNRPGTLGRLATAIGEVGGNITAIGGFDARGSHLDEDLVVNCSSEDHIERGAAAAVRGRRRRRGRRGRRPHLRDARGRQDRGARPDADRRPRRPVDGLHARRGPGVHRDRAAAGAAPTSSPSRRTPSPSSPTAPPCSGLGDIGPAGALPVMEGKALLFKEFAGVDAFPICLDVTTPDEIVETVVRIAPGVRRHQPRGHRRAGAASRSRTACKELLDIPVFHDDQHGTAVVVLAALENAPADRRQADERPARSSSPAWARPAWPSARSCWRRAWPRSSASTARAPSGRAATTSTWPSSGSPSTPTPSAARAR